MKKLICLSVLVMALTGCATTAKYEAQLNSWLGSSENALIAAWGVPDQEYRMSDGSRAIAYIRKDTLQTGGYPRIVPQTTYETGTIGNKTISTTSTTYALETEPVQQYKLYCKTSFVLDASGKVKSWHHEGNNCISQ